MSFSDDSCSYDYYDDNQSESESEYDSDDTASDREYYTDSKYLLDLNKHYDSDCDGPSKYCSITTGNYNFNGAYFKPNMKLYLTLIPRRKERYIYLFLAIGSSNCQELESSDYHEKIQLSENEKSLIQYHVKNSACDVNLIRSCFHWASYYNLKEEKQQFFDLIVEFREVDIVDLIICICKNNDKIFAQKLIEHKNFKNLHEHFRFACIHSNDWDTVKIFMPNQQDDCYETIIHTGICEAIRLRNNNVVEQLLKYVSHPLHEYIGSALNFGNGNAIAKILEYQNKNSKDGDEDLNIVFIKRLNDLTLTEYPMKLIEVFLNVVEDTNIEDIDISKTLFNIIIYLSTTRYDDDLLKRVINFEKNTITDYNNIFEKLLTSGHYNILHQFVDIHKVIPVAYNGVSDNVKHLLIDKMCRNTFEMMKNLFDIVKQFSYSGYEKITRTLLGRITEYFSPNIVELLLFIISKKPVMIDIVNEFQEKIYYNHWHNKNFKLWIDSFPLNSDILLKLLSDAEYHKSKHLLQLLQHDSQPVFECVTNKLLSIINKEELDFHDFDLMHLLIVNYNMNEIKCIELANIIMEKTEYNLGNDAIMLLRLKIYDFDAIKIVNPDTKLNFDCMFEDCINMDWCMRQYLYHNLSPKIIWKYILTQMDPLDNKINLICWHLTKNLDRDVALNICTMIRLMNYWELINDNFHIFVDYEIVTRTKNENFYW